MTIPRHFTRTLNEFTSPCVTRSCDRANQLLVLSLERHALPKERQKVVDHGPRRSDSSVQLLSGSGLLASPSAKHHRKHMDGPLADDVLAQSRLERVDLDFIRIEARQTPQRRQQTTKCLDHVGVPWPICAAPRRRFQQELRGAEARLKIRPEELAPHAHLGAGGSRRWNGPSLELDREFGRREDGRWVAEVILVKG